MHQRSPLCGRQSFRCLLDESNGLPVRGIPLGGTGPRFQLASLDLFHDDVVQPHVLTGQERLDDVRVSETNDLLRVLDEARHEAGSARVTVIDNHYRHRLAKMNVRTPVNRTDNRLADAALYTVVA